MRRWCVAWTLNAVHRRHRYGAAKEQFTHVVFLNLAQSVVCLCWSGLWLLVRPAPAGSAPGWLFWRVGLTNTVGPACGVLALKNIRHACAALVPWCSFSTRFLHAAQLHGAGASKVVQTDTRDDCALRHGWQAILGAGVHSRCADCWHEHLSARPSAPMALRLIHAMFSRPCRRYFVVRCHQELRGSGRKARFSQRPSWLRARLSEPGNGRVHECIPRHGSCACALLRACL